MRSSQTVVDACGIPPELQNHSCPAYGFRMPVQKNHVRIPGVNDKERREIIVKLAERGVNCNVHYKPLPMMTAYKALGFDIKNFPNAYNAFVNEITLPLNTRMSDDDIEYVIENFIDILKNS